MQSACARVKASGGGAGAEEGGKKGVAGELVSGALENAPPLFFGDEDEIVFDTYSVRRLMMATGM